MIRILAFAAVLVLGTAWALDPPPATPPATDAEAPPAASEPVAPAAEAPAATAEDDDGESLPPLPAGTAPRGPTPQRFDPSEEVRADFPVSFPVDI